MTTPCEKLGEMTTRPRTRSRARLHSQRVGQPEVIQSSESNYPGVTTSFSENCRMLEARPRRVRADSTASAAESGATVAGLSGDQRVDDWHEARSACE